MWFHDFFSKQVSAGSIHLISISGFCTPFMLKFVEGISMILQFHEFFSTNFLAGFFLFSQKQVYLMWFHDFLPGKFQQVFGHCIFASYSEFVKLLQAWVLSVNFTEFLISQILASFFYLKPLCAAAYAP